MSDEPQSTPNGRTVRLSDKSPGTQRAFKWFFRLLYGWVALVLIGAAVMVLSEIWFPV
ncbi:MAG: hypothetical protein AAGD13_12505 [Pseudomonadota bacterium]